MPGPKSRSPYDYLLSVAVILGLLGQIGCTRNESPTTMIEYPPIIDIPMLLKDRIPVVLVGVAETPAIRVGSWHKSRYDGSEMQLFRTKMLVENVLQGAVKPASVVEIFFYAYIGSLIGSADPMYKLKVGERVLFFLQRDQGRLRLICDGYFTCSPRVLTGRHSNVKTGPSISLDDEMMEILLTRGEGANDEGLAKAIEETQGMAVVAESRLRTLQYLADTETPHVRKAACEELERLLAPCKSDSSAPNQGGKNRRKH